MWPWKQQKVSKARTQAEDAIANTLTGGDSLPAWNAIWDLVQSRDAQGKQELLTELRGYVENSVANDSVEQARSFEHALDQSMRPHHFQQDQTSAGDIVRHARPVLPSKEVRDQGARDQIESHREAMRDIGVRPGEGIPMWALYMTRRNKRSWG